MALLPKTTCPKCNGPVTFFEVMSVVTPFQSIDCSTCGEMIFLKHKMELLLISLTMGVIVFLMAVVALTKGFMSVLATYASGLVILLMAEVMMTAYIIKKRDVVVRGK